MTIGILFGESKQGYKITMIKIRYYGAKVYAIDVIIKPLTGDTVYYADVPSEVMSHIFGGTYHEVKGDMRILCRNTW